MSPERAHAYRRVLETLEELGPSKLQPHEQDRIRYAADSLLFTAVLDEDESARDALADAEQLCVALVESGRWEQVTASRLAHDVRSCGPLDLVVLSAA
jgi:hypothetical protein